MTRAAGIALVTLGLALMVWGGLRLDIIWLTGGFVSAMCGAYAVHRNQLNDEKD